MDCVTVFISLNARVVLAILCLLSWQRESLAQARPPDLPTNALALPVPYAQGIANIQAQGAARPQATRPRLPGELPVPGSQPIGAPAGSPSNASPQR